MISRQQLINGQAAVDPKVSKFCQYLNRVDLTQQTITLFGKRKPSLMDEVNDIIVYSYRLSRYHPASIRTGFLLRFIPSPTGHRNSYGDYLKLMWNNDRAKALATEALVGRLKVELEPLGYLVKPGLYNFTTSEIWPNGVTVSW